MDLFGAGNSRSSALLVRQRSFLWQEEPRKKKSALVRVTPYDVMERKAGQANVVVAVVVVSFAAAAAAMGGGNGARTGATVAVAVDVRRQRQQRRRQQPERAAFLPVVVVWPPRPVDAATSLTRLLHVSMFMMIRGAAAFSTWSSAPCQTLRRRKSNRYVF